MKLKLTCQVNDMSGLNAFKQSTRLLHIPVPSNDNNKLSLPLEFFWKIKKSHRKSASLELAKYHVSLGRLKKILSPEWSKAHWMPWPIRPEPPVTRMVAGEVALSVSACEEGTVANVIFRSCGFKYVFGSGKSLFLLTKKRHVIQPFIRCILKFSMASIMYVHT